MISYIKIANFRSIVQGELRLTYDEGKAPNGSRSDGRLFFIECGKGKCRCVPVLAVFGPNAAGKTNFLRAVVNLWDVAGGIRQQDVRELYAPNLISKCGDRTSFEVELLDGRKSYLYSVSYSDKGILREELRVDGTTVFAVDGGRVSFGKTANLTPVYTQALFQERFSGECSNGKGVVIRSFLGFFHRNFRAVSAEIETAYDLLVERTKVIGFDRDSILPKAVDELCRVANLTQKEALGEIVEVVRRLDVDIRSVDMTTEKVDPLNSKVRMLADMGLQVPSVVYSIKSHHLDTEGKDVVFDFESFESAGTIRLAALVGNMLCAVKSGATYFIDELELSLHPLLVRELLNLFLQKSRNPNGAQLVFTTQMTDIMDDEVLRLSEIAIVGKNRFKGSKMRRLVDLRNGGEDIRNVTKFRKRYLEGHYSGIPHAAL